MSLSHAYGTPPPPAQAAAVLLTALDLGYTHLDTAALYGFGANERLIGEVLERRRGDYLLATKGGLLFLGSAETADWMSELFTVVDKKHRIYRSNVVQRPPKEGKSILAMHEIVLPLLHQALLSTAAARGCLQEPR